MCQKRNLRVIDVEGLAKGGREGGRGTSLKGPTQDGLEDVVVVKKSVGVDREREETKGGKEGGSVALAAREAKGGREGEEEGRKKLDGKVAGGGVVETNENK